MPLFSVDVEKRLSSEFWSNRYIVRATSLALAQTFAGTIVAVEGQIHSSLVTFTRYRVSTVDQNDENYVIIPLNAQGQRTTSQLLPLFNTLRVDIVPTSGRPSRKFYRGVLQEDDINGDAVINTFSAFIDNFVNDLIITETGPQIVDPQDTVFTDANIHPFVQMRQLRRSRRKRTNGGGIFQ